MAVRFIFFRFCIEKASIVQSRFSKRAVGALFFFFFGRVYVIIIKNQRIGGLARMESPLVSIIVPIYNSAMDMVPCLESIKRQR